MLDDFYEPIRTGLKPFEIRVDDGRNFEVSDTLTLKPWTGKAYIKKAPLICTVSYITNWGQKPKTVVMAIIDVKLGGI